MFKKIKELNKKLALNQNSVFLYECFLKIKKDKNINSNEILIIIDNFEKTRPLYKYKIDYDSENNIYNFIYEDNIYPIKNDEELNKIRYFLLTNKYDKSYDITKYDKNIFKKDIKYLLNKPYYKYKLIQLILKNLKFYNIDEKEIIEILNKYETDNQILIQLNKLKFDIKKFHKKDKNNIEGDIIRGTSRINELKKLFDAINFKLLVNKDSKYLDIGSGNGVITDIIGKELGFSKENIYGIEISKWIEKNHEGSYTAINTTYIKGDNLPFDNNSFDLISCIMSIHHFEYKEKMLNEIYRVLKPGGILIIREHEYDYSKEMKILIDLEHAIFSNVIDEKIETVSQINRFFSNYFGDYFSFEELKKNLKKRNIHSLQKYIKPSGITNYYWCVFKKDTEKIDTSKIYYYFNNKDNTIDLSKLKFTKESIYSVTHWEDAKIISDKIEYLFRPNQPNQITVTDATANVGGNTIGFLESGFNVNSVEIDKTTCDYLKNNILLYNYPISGVYCENYLDVYKKLKQDVIFFDPPWGGTDYKKNKVLDLFLGDINIVDLIKDIFNNEIAKLVVLKAPNNFNKKRLFDTFNITSYYIEEILIRRKEKILYSVFYIYKKK